MEQFKRKYFLTDNVLGTGNFSVVKLAYEKRNIENSCLNSYAVKIMDQRDLTDKSRQGLQQEIEILQMMDHDNIIRLYDTYDVSSHVYLVTELMSGGELFDRIVKNVYYNEGEARDVCKILFDTVAYCHERKIAHRDLKPRNLLLKSIDNDYEITIADFGLAKIAESDNSLITECGTILYVSPENVIGLPYGTKTDVWSMGVIMYILLCGYPPFFTNDKVPLKDLIIRGQYKFHNKYWSNISDDAKDLISSLLTVNPDKRISAADASKSRWIQNDRLADNDLVKSLKELKKFNARRKLKGAALATIAVGRLTNSLTKK